MVQRRPLRGRIHYRRLWLNRPGFHGSAHVIAQVELQKDDDGALDVVGSFSMADCRRSATLDFDVFSNASSEDRRNTLRKARLLRESVNAFVDALEQAVDEYDADRRARRRKAPKPRKS